MMDVSVVIPTADRPLLLLRALDSVRAATSERRVSAEVIVVDDEHSDSTKVLVEQNRPSCTLTYMRNPAGPRRGPSACRNFGVRNSRGAIIAWLDDDDIFLPNRFERCLEPLRQGTQEVVLETAIRERPRPGGSIEEYLTGPGREGADPDPFRFLLTEPEAGHIATGATTFTRRAFNRVGGLDEKLNYGEDGEFLLRLSLLVRTLLLPGPPVARIFQHGMNTSSPSRLRYWGPLKAMRALYRNVPWDGLDAERAFLLRSMSEKVDFALTHCRLEYPYPRRLREGLATLRWLPFRALTWRNLKSIAVWLTRSGRG